MAAAGKAIGRAAKAVGKLFGTKAKKVDVVEPAAPRRSKAAPAVDTEAVPFTRKRASHSGGPAPHGGSERSGQTGERSQRGGRGGEGRKAGSRNDAPKQAPAMKKGAAKTAPKKAAAEPAVPAKRGTTKTATKRAPRKPRSKPQV